MYNYMYISIHSKPSSTRKLGGQSGPNYQDMPDVIHTEAFIYVQEQRHKDN